MPLESGHSLLVPILLLETATEKEIYHLGELLFPIVVAIGILLSNWLHHLHLCLHFISWCLKFLLRAIFRVYRSSWIYPSNYWWFIFELFVATHSIIKNRPYNCWYTTDKTEDDVKWVDGPFNCVLDSWLFERVQVHCTILEFSISRLDVLLFDLPVFKVFT